jgi:hypothetical protein
VAEAQRKTEELKALHEAQVKEERAKEKAERKKREKQKQAQKRLELAARQAKEDRAFALEAAKLAEKSKQERAAEDALRADLRAHEEEDAKDNRKMSKSKRDSRQEGQTQPHPAGESDDGEAWRARRRVVTKKINAHLGGAIASQLELTRAGTSGRTAVSHKHNVTSAEMHRPVLSADQHLHKLEALNRNGRITRTESELLYNRVLESVNTPTRKKSRRSRRKVSVAAAAYRHRQNTRGSGDPASSPGQTARPRKSVDGMHTAKTPKPAPPRTRPFRRVTKTGNQIRTLTGGNGSVNSGAEEEGHERGRRKPRLTRSSSMASGIQFCCARCGSNCNTSATGSQCPECGHETELQDAGASSGEENNDEHPSNSPLIQTVFSHHDDWIGKVGEVMLIFVNQFPPGG